MNPTWLYVGALYAIAVALARRGANPIPKRVAAFFYVLVVLFFFKAMTGPYVSIATDIPRLIAPWSASSPGLTKYTVLNMETHDVAMQLAPWANQVREAWRSGHVPLWNALAGCGYPLLANAQSAAFSPLRLLALPLPLGYSMTAEAAMKVLIALTFTFLYCRRRYETLASSIAAIAYGFGPFVIAWLHFAQGTAACFLPAVLYQIDLLVERRTDARFAMTAVIGAALIFCGHPETAVHILLFAIAYVLWLALVEREWKFLPALIAAGVVASLLAMPLIVPFAENVRESTRFESQKTWGRDMPFSDGLSLALLLQPRLYGTRPGNPWGPAMAEAVTGFSGILGIAALLSNVCDTIARRRFRDREVFLVLVAIGIFAVLANAGPAVAVLHAALGLAANARLRFLFAWILAVLIAAALDRLHRGVVAPFIAGLVAAAALLAIVVIRTPFPSAAARHDGLISVIPTAIVLIVALVTAAVTASAPRVRHVAAMLLAVAVIAEMWPLTIGWNSAFPTTTFYPRTPLIDAVLSHHRPGFDRVAGIGGVLFPNTNAMFGIEDVRVHDPMEPARYVHLLGPVLTSDYYKKWIDASSPLLNRLNARWVMTEPGHELSDTARYQLRYAGADGMLYENLQVQPRFFASGRRVQITAAGGDDYTLHVDPGASTLISSSVGWSRWWRADAGGERLAIKLVDGALLGFVVPAGGTTVRLRYVPVSFYVAVFVALLTAALLVCFMIRARVQRFLGLRRRALRDRDLVRAPLDSGGP